MLPAKRQSLKATGVKQAIDRQFAAFKSKLDLDLVTIERYVKSYDEGCKMTRDVSEGQLSRQADDTQYVNTTLMYNLKQIARLQQDIEARDKSMSEQMCAQAKASEYPNKSLPELLHMLEHESLRQLSLLNKTKQT